MALRRLTALLAVLVPVVFAPRLRADEASATATLEWTRGAGAEGCVDQESLARRVDRQLARIAVVAPSDAGLVIRGRVERVREGAPGFRAQVSVTAKGGTPLGTRDLETERADCSALDDSLTLVVALLIDPEHALGSPPPKEPPPAPPSLPPTSEKSGVDAADHGVTGGSRPAPWHAELFSSGALLVGLTPSPAPGLRFGATLLPSWLPPVQLGVGWYWSESTAGAAEGGSFGLLEGSLDLCPPLFRTSRVRGSVCAGADAAAMRAQGFGFTHDQSHTQPMLALEAGAQAVVHLAGPILATFGVRALVPLVRPDFVYADAAGSTPSIYQPAAVAAAGEIGLRALLF
jgi:hypothetical protein